MTLTVQTDVRDSLLRLDRWMTERDYTGWDPYDGLLSPFAVLPGRRGRQAVVQTIKRLPAPLRRAVAVPQRRMNKTLSLVVCGLRAAPWLPDAERRADDLVAELRQRRRVGWGYEFDVQTRWGHYPASSPNTVVTAFVTEAVWSELEQAEREEIETWWLETMLHPGGWFRYAPGADVLIHNANLLAARALLRVAPHRADVATRALERSRPAEPRALPAYGEAPGLEWIDNFHTAYIIDCLLDLLPSAPSAARMLESLVGPYLDQCFAASGRPMYYAQKNGPTDVHNVATAVTTLSRLNKAGYPCPDELEGSLHALTELQQPDGAFVATDRQVPFMRWNQAHAFRALAEVARR